MKTKLFLLVTMTALLASCNLDKKMTINIGSNTIEPSGTIVKKELRQKPFSKIDVDVIANVKFIQSETDDYRVVMSVPENYVELFKIEVDNDELEIDFTRDNINIDAKNVDLTIYAPTLNKLENDGVASVEIDRLNTGQLEVDNSGVGSIYLRGLTVDRLEADCSGVGNIELGGTANTAQLECSGVGSIKAKDLKAKSVRGEVSGVGGITCFAEEELDADVSGVGALKYYGDPKEVRKNRSGVGAITKM